KNRAFMGEFRVQDWICSFSARFADLPDADTVVRSPGKEAFAIGTKSDGIDFFEGLRKSLAPLAGRNVPEFHGPIRAGAHQDFSGRPKCQMIDATVMAGKRLEFFGRGNIPKLYFLIIAARCEC